MKETELYSIGDAARRTGLTVSAIRFYADAGVIAPTEQTDAGHRLYDVDAIARLELVRTMRDLGAGLTDIRALLAEELSLRELASAHLDLVERQLRDLRARRAVLRTIVNQPTTTDRVKLMHSLVSLSDDERNQLLDLFWNEVTDGLAVHPAFVEQLHAMRPHLPEEPGTEQLQAWIELADLVQDKAFRDAVREFFHSSFASPRAMEMTSPERLARIEEHRLIEIEAADAERAGLSPDSAQAKEIAERMLASIAGLADVQDVAGLRRSMTDPEPGSAAERYAEHAVSGFGGLLGSYLALMATINGTPQPDPNDTGVSEQWIAAALRAR
ncbi:MerR family transcriptional regulator [Allokutzneria sp. NRRL B-24872]|uniref:helix-turn-helix domain-containing protein n=1 Tax=Allokutzneria sp. NRRL B-24872 TaxID=1137961 RepID=UPI000A391BBE|nr:MerR family transcriptional regulator [Allokutzneria sp. NRRL B-24872]